MRKIKSILVAVFLLAVAAGSYLYYSIRIFTSPNIQFVTVDPVRYRPVQMTERSVCYEADDVLPPLEQDKFGLLVWNLHKGKDTGWQEALARFADNADFLLLQEVTDRQNLFSRFSSRFSAALYVSAFAYLGEQSGVNTLSKAAPDLYCAGMEKEPWIIIPKVGSAVRFPLKNEKSLLVVNLHLVNFELNPTNYRNQLETMMKLIARHQGPIILAGDFNSWNEGRQALISRLAAENRLTEVRYQPDYRLRFIGNPLDHVFIRGFKVIQATTQETAASDHNPLLVELELLP